MNIKVLADFDEDSYLRDVLDAFWNEGFSKYFAKKNYGKNDLRISVFFMCQRPDFVFKQRIRHSKNDNVLYIDIMLDYYEIKSSDFEKQKRVVANCFISEINRILRKYDFEEFDTLLFLNDLKHWFQERNWMMS